MDPISLVMLALIGVLIFFMFRNGRKRQQAMQELQAGLRPGAEVMLQSGIFGTVDSVDEEAGRVTILSGSSTFVVHRNAVSQIVSAVESAPEDEGLAPEDDPQFGERISGDLDEPPADDEPGAEDGPSTNKD